VQYVNGLKQRPTDVWAGAEQNVIDNATDQRCRRLHVCFRATGVRL